MSDEKISAMPAAAALTGAELVPVVQGGANVKATTQNIANLAPAGPTGANPTATAGPAAINGAAATFMRSDAAPAVQLGTNAQKGIVQVDGTTITAAAGIISATATGANPTATVGTAVVNGAAATFMRSDASPPLAAGSAIAGPRSLVYKLGQVTTKQSHTGDLLETLLGSVKVPGNIMGANGGIRASFMTSRNQTGASSATIFMRFGAANDLTGTLIASFILATFASYFISVPVIGTNRNATNSQIWPGATTTGPFSGTIPTTAIDTTADAYFVISGQLQTNTDTIALEFLHLEFLPAGGN